MYIINRGIQNPLLHPLAKYKGHFLWRAFRLPFVRSLLSSTLPHQVKRMHEQYGEIVLGAPDKIASIDPAAWKDIYADNFVGPYECKDKTLGKNAES